jgi:hypothetical protein
MSQYERWGRILLALAVALLFVMIFVGMLTGNLFMPLLVATIALAVVGAAGMLYARARP